MNLQDDRALPGADLVAQGSADLEAGCETQEALLVAIGEPKLRSLGLDLLGMAAATLSNDRLHAHGNH
jgi:hypothetical protein